MSEKDFEILRNNLVGNPDVIDLSLVPEENREQAEEEAEKYYGGLSKEHLDFFRQYILRPNQGIVGIQDGVRENFGVTGGTFLQGTTMLYKDGARLRLGDDYNETGDNGVRISTPPLIGDKFVLDYVPNS